LIGAFTVKKPAMVYIVMGVSGAGKTTIGKLLAQKLGLPFYDGDDFHTEESISKMTNGLPLTDDDREGWLQTLADSILKWQLSSGAVLACSALKEKHREILRSKAANTVEWIFIQGSKNLIKERLQNRKNHFMGTNLVNSQFEILEEPVYGISVSADNPPEIILEEILMKLGGP
jgi:carbohydrate kinase (thermoresistant glucokinase family)